MLRVLRSLSSCSQYLAEVRRSQRIDVGVTIGNFDGMHLGHQALFSAVRSALLPVETASSIPEGQSSLEGQPSEVERFPVICSFYPHPRKLFAIQDNSPNQGQFSALNSAREKIELAGRYGFKLYYGLRFSREFSTLKPEDFVSRYIVRPLQPKVVVVGHDWAFGRGRSGGVELLQELAKRFSFKLQIIPPVVIDGVRVSSGELRTALSSGDLPRVQRFIGRSYSVSGRVGHGDKRGRELGFPTANLEFVDKVLPKDGIYACWVELEAGRFRAATSIGTRPTFGPGGRRLVEVHVLDLPKEMARTRSRDPHDLYGQRVTVEFVERIRESLAFTSSAELRRAMEGDVCRVRAILS